MLGGYIDREDLMELVEVKKEGRGARISINDGFKEVGIWLLRRILIK